MEVDSLDRLIFFEHARKTAEAAKTPPRALFSLSSPSPSSSFASSLRLRRRPRRRRFPSKILDQWLGFPFGVQFLHLGLDFWGFRHFGISGFRDYDEELWPELNELIQGLVGKIEKDKQALAKALSKSSKECENTLKEETAKFQAMHEKFGKEKTTHLQALKDTISKYEEEKERHPFYVMIEKPRVDSMPRSLLRSQELDNAEFDC
ncbi:hypothetical protein Drorol1_Dr00000272 [Drosera rotundifolia]